MSKTKKENKKKKSMTETSGDIVVKNIIKNYQQLEQSIVSQLDLCNKLHSTTTGSAREDVWLQLFEMIIPKKFVIEHSVFIIDSYRNISREVDLAIIDNNYTPYIFQFGRLKYVPIEAVAAVIECKSTSISFHDENVEPKDKKADMTDWCKSIQQLKTSRASIARMAAGMVVEGLSYRSENEVFPSSTQTATRPLRIFCGYNTNVSKENFDRICKFFDFALIAKNKGNDKKIDIIIPASLEEQMTLDDWYKELDHYNHGKNLAEGEKEPLEVTENKKLGEFTLDDFKIKQEEEEIPLLTFNFQLNQLLMLINNPMLFPHLAYVNMFNGASREETC